MGCTGFPGGISSKEPTCQCRRSKRCLPSRLGRFPWSRKWQPTPAISPGKFHGQRSLVGYSPWGHKHSDTTEHTSTHAHTWDAQTRDMQPQSTLLYVCHLFNVMRKIIPDWCEIFISCHGLYPCWFYHYLFLKSFSNVPEYPNNWDSCRKEDFFPYRWK